MDFIIEIINLVLYKNSESFIHHKKYQKKFHNEKNNLFAKIRFLGIFP